MELGKIRTGRMNNLALSHQCFFFFHLCTSQLRLKYSLFLELQQVQIEVQEKSSLSGLSQRKEKVTSPIPGTTTLL